MTDQKETAQYVLAGRLRWLQLDEHWVVFGVSSGTLLRADALTAAVCVLLEDGGESAQSLAGRVAASMQSDVTEALASRIAEVLDELQASGLVQCHSP